jgi:hypothetical protein
MLLNYPSELFKVVRGIGNQRIVNYVVLSFLWESGEMKYPKMRYWTNIIQAELYPKRFFKKSKKLMHYLVTRNNWTLHKEALSILLSIQRKYLYLLKGDEKMLREVIGWIELYEFIYRSFDPDDLDVLLRLFHYLQSMALNHGEQILKTDPPNPSISKLMKLFKLYGYHIYCFNRESWISQLFLPSYFTGSFSHSLKSNMLEILWTFLKIPVSLSFQQLSTSFMPIDDCKRLRSENKSKDYRFIIAQFLCSSQVLW